MEKIITYNPAVSSLNRGDDIISDSCKCYLSKLYPEAFIVDISTHLPVSNMFLSHFKDFKMRFVLGSNLLASNMNAFFRQWDVTWFTMRAIAPVILMGVGWRTYQNDVNAYTKILYKNVLSKNYYHSVRDEYSEAKLKKAGVQKVLMTGCPTLWNLTPEFCNSIPRKKARRVVTTITDYRCDVKADYKLIKLLQENYEEVYLWIQGSNDYDYLRENDMLSNVNLISPNLYAYDKFLSEHAEHVDYVGTRLHGGIRALQNRVRSIIIGIDNRSVELQKSCNIPVCDRNDFSRLLDRINGEFETKVVLPQDNIDQWLNQFKYL